MKTFTHPRFNSAIPGMWPSVCSIRTKSIKTNAANEKLRQPTTPSDDVPGLSSIECRVAVLVRSAPPSGIKKTERTTTDYSPVEVLLNIYAPDIVEDVHLAVVDGIEYEIRTVESDSQFTRTRLKVEVIN